MGKSNKWKLNIPLVIFVAMVVISASGCANNLKTSNSDQANNPALTQNPSSAYSSQPVSSGPVNPSSNAGPSENAVVLSITSIHMVSDQVGWAVGQRGQVLRTEDGGATWSDVTPSEMGQIRYTTMLALPGLDSKHELIAKLGNRTVNLYGTSDSGTKLTMRSMLTLPKALSSQVYASFVDSKTGWLLTTSEPACGLMQTALFVTHDGGKTWSTIDAKTLPQGGMYESGLTFADDTRGWITGMNHANFTPLYMTTDGGHSWHLETLPLPSGASYVDTYAPRFFGQRGVLPTIYHVGSQGPEVMVYHTNNGGKTWDLGTGFPAGDAGYPQGPAWSFINVNQGFATDASVIYRTEDAGQHWTKVQPNVSLKGTTELDFRTADEGWAIVGGRLLKTTDGGSTWNPVGTNRSTGASNADKSTPAVTLENMQFEDNALVLIMTHGTMQTTYTNPHFSTGTLKQFIVTLRDTSPGKYLLSQVQPINAIWAKNMLIEKNGSDLILTFDLKHSFSSFQTGIAGGFEIQFSFK